MKLDDPNLLADSPCSTPFKVNWKLVVGIVFGFLVWYVGVAMLEKAVNQADCTCCPIIPSQCEETP